MFLLFSRVLVNYGWFFNLLFFSIFVVGRARKKLTRTFFALPGQGEVRDLLCLILCVSIFNENAKSPILLFLDWKVSSIDSLILSLLVSLFDGWCRFVGTISLFLCPLRLDAQATEL